MRIAFAFLAVALAFAAPPVARAWGATPHRLINAAAIGALPAELPAFVRSDDAIATIGALGPEADRLRGAGTPRDADLDPAHFLNVADDGTLGGAVALGALPASRDAYDTLLRTGPPAGGHVPDQYAVGYLPYEIVDGWEGVAKDFAIWRADVYGEQHAANDADRARFALDRRRREALTLRDIGYWGHFVADGSQPLHVTVHYNGWGPYPNPEGFTQARTLHAFFETAFAGANATTADVASRIGPYAPSAQPIVARVQTYLAATARHVPELYRIEKAGGFRTASPEAVAFTRDRLADGARTLRDLVADAYAAAADLKVGYPGATVHEIEAGTVPITPALIGLDNF